MQIFGDHILVVGHSSGESGPELSLFRLGADGRLVRDGAPLLVGGRISC
jgi:hypothetical protein